MHSGIASITQTVWTRDALSISTAKCNGASYTHARAYGVSIIACTKHITHRQKRPLCKCNTNPFVVQQVHVSTVLQERMDKLLHAEQVVEV